MFEETYSYEYLVKIIDFLSKEKGVSIESFIQSVQERMNKRQIELNNLCKKILALPSNERDNVITKITTLTGEKMDTKYKIINKIEGIYNLQELYSWDIKELVKTKPRRLFINQMELKTEKWADVSFLFVKFLIDNGDIQKKHLPICPNTKKAFINSFPGQPSGTLSKNGSFKEVKDGFFVDTKYSAKYHVINIYKTMKILMLLQKYTIRIEL